MKEKIFSIDLGSKLLKVCVAEEDENGKINLLTKLLKNSEIFSDGEVIDQEGFITEIIQAIQHLADQINEIPKNIILSFSASSFSFQRIKGKTSVADRYINDEDIKKSHLIAKASLASGNYENLFEQPISYFIDGTNIKVRDPLGLEARTLEVDFCLIQSLKSSLFKLNDLFTRNSLKPVLILPNPIPASFILLPKRDKELGVILVDFGYKIFNISIFQEGKLIFYQNFKFGLADILEDLAIDFGIDVQEIDDFLNSFKNFLDKKKTAPREIKSSGLRIGRQKYNYSQILKLVEKKFVFYWRKNNLHEIFRKTKENFRLPAGIFLIGGGSYLPDIENIFKKYSGYTTKIGFDNSENLSFDERIFLNSLGAIFYYQKSFPAKSFLGNLFDLFKGLFR